MPPQSRLFERFHIIKYWLRVVMPELIDIVLVKYSLNSNIMSYFSSISSHSRVKYVDMSKKSLKNMNFLHIIRKYSALHRKIEYVSRETNEFLSINMYLQYLKINLRYRCITLYFFNQFTLLAPVKLVF